MTDITSGSSVTLEMEGQVHCGNTLFNEVCAVVILSI